MSNVKTRPQELIHKKLRLLRFARNDFFFLSLRGRRPRQSQCNDNEIQPATTKKSKLRRQVDIVDRYYNLSIEKDYKIA